MTDDISNIRIKDYHYDLPGENIARYPLKDRDLSKLLVYKSGNISQDIFRNIGNYLSPGDILVRNQTRVIKARLRFKKESGAQIEIFCLEPVSPADYERNFMSAGQVEWKCLIGNNKKWKGEKLELHLGMGSSETRLTANKISTEGGESIVEFSWDNDKLVFSDILSLAGHVPIPPYLKRDEEVIDRSRYQTIYAKNEGSVAAPTAGLHFTGKLLDKLETMGVRSESLTLHVGAGTFKPVKSEMIMGHNMHIEHFSIEKSSLENLMTGRIIAVGTTSVRTLESIYWLGHMLEKNMINTASDIFIEQWYPYQNETNADYREYYNKVLSFMESKGIEILEGRTGIIIVPGYKPRAVKGLITNYHMPGSTLLLLVAAFTGSKWRDIYEYSLRNDFRFLSYGDSCLIIS